MQCRIIIFLVVLPLISFSQTKSITDDSLLTEGDSLTIFRLIDSLINLEPVKVSQVAVRVGYTSNLNATGKPFEFGEFGVTTKAAFYHKTGLFLDASGYWSNQYQPWYYLTTASLGYMNTNYKKWSFLLEYSRYIYNIKEQSSPISIIYTYNDNYSSRAFKNCFTGAVYFDYKKLLLKFDYALYTGDRTGHRFNPSISFSFQKNNWIGIQRISVLPTFSVLLGIEEVPYYVQLYRTRLEALFRIRNNLPLFSQEERNEFGVMNYALRFPIMLSQGNWSFNISYSYNFPKRLPGETAQITNGGSLAFGVVRYFDVKSK